MTPPRSTRRVLGWLVATVLVALGGSLAVFTARLPTLVADTLVARAAAAGVQLTVAPLGLANLHLSGLTLPSLTVAARGVTLHCQDARLWVPLRDVLEGRRSVDRVEATSCALTGTYAAPAPAQTPADPATASAPPWDRLQRAAAQALARVGAVEVDRWEVDAQWGARDLRAAGERFAMHADGPGLRLRSYARLRAPLTTTMASWEATLSPTDGATLHTDARIEVAGATLGAERFALLPDGTLRIDVGALSMPLQGNGLAVGFNTVEVALPGLVHPTADDAPSALFGACPRLRLGTGQILVQRPPPPLEAPPAPTPALDDPPTDEPPPQATARPPSGRGTRRGGEALPVVPSIGTQRLGQLLDATTWLRAQQQRALAAMPTCLDLQMADVTVDLGHQDAVHIRDLQLHDDGRVVAEVAWRGIEVAVDTNRLLLETVTFAASGVPLSPLSGAIDGVELGGTLQAQGTLALAETSFSFQGDVQIQDGRLVRPAISPLPLDGMQIAGQTSLVIQDGEAPSVAWNATGTFNDVPLDATVALDRRDDQWRLVADGGVSAPIPCRTMFGAIPAGMLPNLGADAMRFAGEAAPRLGVRYTVGDPWTLRLSAEGFPGTCEITWVERAWDPRQLNDPDYRHHVTEGTTLPDLYVGPGTENWVPLDTLPPYVPAAMFLSEEIQFYTNPGISLGLIQRGTSLNLERGRYAYGGSTVSQQLVKNLFLSRAKTLSRKLEEVLIVWAMEQWVTKDRILELYLNCIEFGPDLYGLQAAARHYFAVEPHELTPLEATFLAGLKPSPLSGARHRARGTSPATGWWPERNQEILSRMVRYGYLPPEELVHYAPYVVGFPPSPLYGVGRVYRIPRPEGALVLNPRDPVAPLEDTELGPAGPPPEALPQDPTATEPPAPTPLEAPAPAPEAPAVPPTVPEAPPAATSPPPFAPVPPPAPVQEDQDQGPGTRTPADTRTPVRNDARPSPSPATPQRRQPTADPNEALQQLRRAP